MKNEDIDIYSLVIGLVIWIPFYINSQDIINKQQFRLYSFYGVAVLICNILFQCLTKDINLSSLIFTTIPLLYVGYFRLILYLFFRDYPLVDKKPTIIFYTRSGIDYEESYSPISQKDRVFSTVLIIGFLIIVGGLIFLNTYI